MTPDSEADLKHRLIAHLDQGTTDMAPAPYANPVSMYTSTDVLAREMQTFFADGVLCVGLSADLPASPEWMTLDIAGRSVVVARDGSGALRAFLNVCRHRGAPVAENRGTARLLTCPYHGWAYDLKGDLIARPKEDGFSAIDKCEMGLTQLPVAEKNGLVFLSCNPARPAIDPATVLGASEDQFASFRLDQYFRFGTRKLSKRMNWKLVVDTFLEAYHLETLHSKSLAPMIHSHYCAWDEWGSIGRLTAPRKSISKMNGGSLAPHVTQLYFLFPNMVLINQQDHVETFQAFPKKGAVDEADIVVSLYCPSKPATDSEERHWKNNFDLLVRVTETEDFDLCEKIQAGFGAGAQTHVTYGRNEPGLQHYHRSIKRALGFTEE